MNEWSGVIAAFINSGLVLLVVQLIKKVLPIINEKASWILPILAGAVGPAVAALQNYLSTVLGVPINLSEIAAIFTGGTAVAIYQVGKQANKVSAPK